MHKQSQDIVQMLPQVFRLVVGGVSCVWIGGVQSRCCEKHVSFNLVLLDRGITHPFRVCFLSLPGSEEVLVVDVLSLPLVPICARACSAYCIISTAPLFLDLDEREREWLESGGLLRNGFW
jgi:hypothetical protein